MSQGLRKLSLCLLAAVALVVAGCGADGGGDRGGTIAGDTLTIYASLPLTGPQGVRGRDVLRGAKLALEEREARASAYRVNLVSLDDAQEGADTWDPARVAGNARRAAQDRGTIAYLGEMSPGASAISIPILNAAGILQVSPSDTVTGLTRRHTGASGEPEKYYPAGDRTFGRIVPPDDVQARALVSYMGHLGVRRLYVVDDGEPFGLELARGVQRAARAGGLELAGSDHLAPERDDAPGLAAKIGATGADAMLFAGARESVARQLWRAVSTTEPALKRFGASAVADAGFARSIGAVAGPTYLTSPALSLRDYPASARRFRARHLAAYGAPPGRDAIFGYEAMSVVLGAISDAGARGNARRAVIDAFFETRDRRSVLGDYSIDRAGDTSLTDYGGYRVVDGRLVFDRLLRAPAG